MAYAQGYGLPPAVGAGAGAAAGGADAVELTPRRAAVQVTKLQENKCKFVLTGTDNSVANALRRAIIAEVPTFAIDLVNIYENGSPMHDEFLAHRLGLVPIRWKHPEKLPQDIFRFPWECECDFQESDVCPKCCIQFRLTVANTNEVDGEPLTVKSTDLALLAPHDGWITSEVDGQRYALHDLFEIAHFATASEAALCAADEGIVLSKVAPGKAIDVLAVARMGIGKVHAKYNPVGTVAMAYEPDIRLNRDIIDALPRAAKKEFVKRVQKGVFRYDKASEQIVLAEPTKANNIEEIRKVGLTIAREHGLSENLVSVSFVPEKYLFKLEGVGSLPPDMIVRSALRRLRARMADLGAQVEHGSLGEAAAAGAGSYGYQFPSTQFK